MGETKNEKAGWGRRKPTPPTSEEWEAQAPSLSAEGRVAVGWPGEGGQLPAKEGLLLFPFLSCQSLSIIHSQGAALTAIKKAFMLPEKSK